MSKAGGETVLSVREPDGTVAAPLALSEPYSLIVLDIGLPGVSGFEVLRRIRAAGSAVPVLILTARDAVADRVRGLDLGAVAATVLGDQVPRALAVGIEVEYERPDGPVLVGGHATLVADILTNVVDDAPMRERDGFARPLPGPTSSMQASTERLTAIDRDGIHHASLHGSWHKSWRALQAIP